MVYKNIGYCTALLTRITAGKETSELAGALEAVDDDGSAGRITSGLASLFLRAV